MGRHRSAARLHWPPNLYALRNGFRYRNPLTRKETWLGTDEAQAFAVARDLNRLLGPYLVDGLVQRVLRGDPHAETRMALKAADLVRELYRVLIGALPEEGAKTGALKPKRKP